MVFVKDDSELEQKEIKKWKRVSDVNGVPIVLRRFIGQTEVVSKAGLAEAWNYDRKTIERNIKKGMPLHKYSYKGFQIFDLAECETWRQNNINRSMAPVAIRYEIKDEKKHTEEQKTEVKSGKNKDLDDISLSEAELLLKIKDLKIKDLKIKELSGKYVTADTADKTIAEFGAMFIGWLINSRESLSGDLANKSKGEVFKILDEHFGSFITEIGKITSKEYGDEDIKISEFLYLAKFKLSKYKYKIFNLISS